MIPHPEAPFGGASGYGKSLYVYMPICVSKKLNGNGNLYKTDTPLWGRKNLSWLPAGSVQAPGELPYEQAGWWPGLLSGQPPYLRSTDLQGLFAGWRARRRAALGPLS